jgi:hypothetical protein
VSTTEVDPTYERCNRPSSKPNCRTCSCTPAKSGASSLTLECRKLQPNYKPLLFRHFSNATVRTMSVRIRFAVVWEIDKTAHRRGMLLRNNIFLVSVENSNTLRDNRDNLKLQKNDESQSSARLLSRKLKNLKVENSQMGVTQIKLKFTPVRLVIFCFVYDE